jgi:hypothetical protein
MPDFNLDADRGYGYHCWDFDRQDGRPTIPKVSKDLQFDTDHYTFATPCTVPEGYCTDSDHAYPPAPGDRYSASTHLAIHYESMDDPGCSDVTKTSVEDVREAGGLSPDGRKG